MCIYKDNILLKKYSYLAKLLSTLMKKLLHSTIFWLLVAIVIGIVVGLFIGETGMVAVLFIKQVSGQIIYFMVPLIILALISSSISSLKGDAASLLLVAFLLAYVSTEGAALLGIGVGKLVIPWLNIDQVAVMKELPPPIYNLEIPPIMSVMSALMLSICLGLGTYWIKSKQYATMLAQFKDMVMHLVNKILIPVLPFFIAANFCALTYKGMLPAMKIFLVILIIAILCHFLWLTILYLVASAYSGKHGWQVVKHYLPAYLTALGTMSSAASLGVALECAKKNDILDDDMVDFCIPLFNNIHLSGSVLTQVLLVCTISQVLYGAMPTFGSLIFFILLLGIFAIGAPGIPSGSVMAAVGLVLAIVMVPDGAGGLMHYTEEGTSLIITLFALQDSFGTGCNLTGDGALTLIVDSYAKRLSKKKSNEK